MSFWKQVWASRPWPLSLIRKREYPHWHLPDDPFDPADWLGGLTEEQIDDALRLIYQDNWYQFLNWPYDEKEIVHADDD